MSTRKKPSSRRPGATLRGIEQIRAPSKALGPLIEILDELCDRTRIALVGAGPASPGYPAFDIAILTRGLNVLEAIRVLSVPLHWEAASSCARQLFELVLNMEALAAMPSRKGGSNRFALYGLLQKTRAQVTEHEYERATGRPVDEKRVAALKDLLDGSQFEVFKDRIKPDGTVVWSKSWSGKTPFELAKASNTPRRIAEYNQLFVAWSEESHATPSVLLDAMFRSGGATWTSDLLRSDLREMSQILVMAIHQYFELWNSLVNVPPLDEGDWTGWFRRINAFVATEWGVLIGPPEFNLGTGETASVNG